MSLETEVATEVEEWVVTWFPPDRDSRTKRFKGPGAEERARLYAALDGGYDADGHERPDVAEWNPILEHRITTTSVRSEIVPL